ncbi:MAG: DUF4345 domain-containing protein [Rhizobiaceae bacterium]
MIEFSWPFSQGEWFAWGFAVFTILYGFVGFVFPRFILRHFGPAFGGNETGERNNAGVSEIRASSGGMRTGFAIAAILLAQPLIYLALGFALAFSVLGRLVSFIFSKAFNVKSLILAIIEGLGAFFMIGYGMMLIP